MCCIDPYHVMLSTFQYAESWWHDVMVVPVWPMANVNDIRWGLHQPIRGPCVLSWPIRGLAVTHWALVMTIFVREMTQPWPGATHPDNYKYPGTMRHGAVQGSLFSYQCLPYFHKQWYRKSLPKRTNWTLMGVFKTQVWGFVWTLSLIVMIDDVKLESW